LRWVGRGVGGLFFAVGVLTVFVIATDATRLAARADQGSPSPSIDDSPLESAPRLARVAVQSVPPRRAMEEGGDGHETLCATTATDDPGATLQPLGAAWRASEARRYRVRVVVAPDAP
jgi:hypothetical protein